MVKSSDMILYNYTRFENKMKFFLWFNLCNLRVSAIPVDNLAATCRMS